jgi:hypothetical protein
MLAARVEQKNGMTKDDKMALMPLDKENPIQAGCLNRARPARCSSDQYPPRRTNLDYETKPISSAESGSPTSHDMDGTVSEDDVLEFMAQD